MIPLLKNIEVADRLKEQFETLFELVKPHIDINSFIEEFNEAMNLYPEVETTQFDQDLWKELTRNRDKSPWEK